MTSQFSEKARPDVMLYLEKRTYPAEIMNKMLVFMSYNQVPGHDAAMEFLKTHEDTWTKWVPADVAEKVKAGL